jgi:hypothetical protein
MLLKAKHPSLTNEKTYLSAAPVATATSLYCKSVAGISSNLYVVVGNPGEEKTEIVLCSAVNSTTNVLTVGALKFGHTIDAPVTVIKYNQVKFYKSATLTGTYNLIQTVDIDIDDEQTVYDYTAGLTTDYFEVSYYNSTTTTESQKSDPLIGTGYSRKALASLIKEIRTYVGTKPTDEELIMAVNTGQDTICGLDDRWHFMHKSSTLTIADHASSASLPSDFLTLDRLEMSIVDGTVTTTTKLKFYTESNFVDKFPTVDTSVTANPSAFTIKESEDKVYTDSIVVDATTPVTVTFKLFYWAKPIDLTEYTDETVIPNPSLLVFWVSSKIEAAKHNTDTSGIFWQEFSSQLKAITNRRKGGEKNFSIGA